MSSKGKENFRCIQVGGPNGPITQGEAQIEGLLMFHTGQQDPTGRATITIGTQKISGELIPSIRNP
ncbi:MAG: hypothetical protein JKX76_00465 [Colwellia sp.]|nr:hypothetical protein [Colwellia sp.]